MGELLDEIAALVRAAVHPARGTISLSPEVAVALEKCPSGASVVGAAAQAGEGNLDAPSEPGPHRTLDELAEVVAGCKACGLCDGRTQTVFGSGNPHADLVFVGEAPGEQEDLQGLPFVGRSGGLLTDIVEKGMKLRWEDVYICNVIKCRPPGNRDPRPDEKSVCEPYLLEQLDLIQPKVICALGGHAATTLLETKESTGRLRGRWHSYHGVPLRVTYHPAYLLRSPGEKKKTWADIQEVIKVLSGESVP
jgi:DNA polymerase